MQTQNITSNTTIKPATIPTPEKAPIEAPTLPSIPHEDPLKRPHPLTPPTVEPDEKIKPKG